MFYYLIVVSKHVFRDQLIHIVFPLRFRSQQVASSTSQSDSHNLLPVDYPALRSASLISPSEYYNPHALTTYPLPHFNAEQRARADAAEELHHDLCHPSDSSLCVNLSTGKLPFSTLTSADVTLNRQIRGPCPHCAAGKHHNPPHPPSPSPPATSIGAVLSFDPQLLPEISPGQHTHEIILVDEFSGC